MQAGNPSAADATGTTKINIEQLFQGMILPGAPTPAAAPTPPQSGAGLDEAFPLHDACARGYLDKVKFFVEDRRVDVNQRGQPPQRWCPLHCTAFSEFKSLEVARYLLESGANPSAQDEDGWTALHFASTKGHAELVQLLLHHRADHGIKDNDGFTPLHEAARNNHTMVVDLLIGAGADVDVRVINASELRVLFKVPRVFATAIKTGRSPLHWAAANGHQEVVERLCVAKADVAGFETNLDTPLFMAAASGKIAVMKTLIKFGANAHATVREGWGLLHQAAHHGQADVLHMGVKELQLAVSEHDTAQHTPLHIAVLRQQVAAVKALLELGAEPNQLGPLSYTPLQYACRWNCQEIGAVLIQSKASVDLADDDGWTPLHWACSSDSLSCVPLLILAGARQTVSDSSGLKPFDVASAPARMILFQSLNMKQQQQQAAVLQQAAHPVLPAGASWGPSAATGVVNGGYSAGGSYGDPAAGGSYADFGGNYDMARGGYDETVPYEAAPTWQTEPLPPQTSAPTSNVGGSKRKGFGQMDSSASEFYPGGLEYSQQSIFAPLPLQQPKYDPGHMMANNMVGEHLGSAPSVTIGDTGTTPLPQQESNLTTAHILAQQHGLSLEQVAAHLVQASNASAKHHNGTGTAAAAQMGLVPLFDTFGTMPGGGGGYSLAAGSAMPGSMSSHVGGGFATLPNSFQSYTQCMQ